NKADQGGGFYNHGTADLADSTIADNRAEQGGGIYNSSGDGGLTLTNCLISRNRARENGGGLYNDLGPATLIDCTFANNSAKRQGGGIFNNSKAELTRTDLTGNRARKGGGLFNDMGDATLTDGTIAGNSGGRGAGYANRFGTVAVVGTLVTDATTQLDVAREL